MQILNDFITRYKNARVVVKQIKQGEWVCHYNSINGKCYIAKRKGVELWIGNGAFFCEIRDVEPSSFGLIFRHYVWWAAARNLLKNQLVKLLED
jgi:hypothetical protein